MGWGRYGDYLLYFVTVTLTLTMFPNTNFYLQLITIDSVFSAIHFFKQFIDYKITESQIVQKSNTLYKCSLLDRYIYYFTSYFLYNTICNFFWVKYIRLIYYGFLISTLPPLLNKIINSYIFIRLRKKKENIIKTILSKQLGSLIKLSSKTYLNRDIEIQDNELVPLFDDYNKTVNYILDIMKNLLIIFLVMYVKKCSTSFYYKLTKYIYNYKTGEILESFNEISAKHTLISIIEQKRWHELLNPNSHRAILYLYQINDDKSDLLKQLFKTINFRLAKMFTIWTISSFFKKILIGPIVSLFMVFYRKRNHEIKMLDSIIEALFIVASGIVGILMKSYFLTSFLSQFGYFLIYNKFIYLVGRYITNEIYKKIKELNAKGGKYLIPIITTTILMMVFGYIVNLGTVVLVMLEFIRGLLISSNKSKSIIYISLLISGFYSNFNPLHLMHNAVVIYILMGTLELSQIVDFIKKIKINIYKIETGLLNEGNILKESIKIVFINLIIFLKNKFNRKDKCMNRFELMDTNRFPSISNKMAKKSKNKESCNSLINDQEILKRLKSNFISLNIKEKLFDLPTDQFIEAISVESDDKFIAQTLDGIENSSIAIDEFSYKKKINEVEINVVEKYC